MITSNNSTYSFQDIEFKIIYSGRRTIGISVLPDSSVLVRVPYLTSFKKICKIVQQKSAWIIKHRDHYKTSSQTKNKLNKLYLNGEIHFFRGKGFVLKIEQSCKPYICINNGTIHLGLKNPDDEHAIKKLMYKGYKREALALFPEMVDLALKKYERMDFRPAGLIIRTMKRRWGSCSNKGVISLSTELIKLPDLFIEYVIAHELCHLKQHNHGSGYYKLLAELFPEWKEIRREMRKYFNH